MIPFMKTSRKCKLIYSCRKQICGCLRLGRLVFLGRLPLRVITKGNKDTLRDDGYVPYIDCRDGFTVVKP